MIPDDDFSAYAGLADGLIEKATTEQIADVARLLALYIGWYHERYDDVPQEELLGLVRTETLSDESKRLLLHGMQNLGAALAEVVGASEDGGEDAQQ
jgi:hypothetical protein